MRKLKVALSFLTVIPVRVDTFEGPEELRNSAVYFPLVGALLGTIFAVTVFLFLPVISSGPVVALLFLVAFLLTRGFHLDGLADTADGLQGGMSRERILAIMRDSSTGAMGAAAILLVYLFKYAALQAAGVGLLPALFYFMPVCGRWSIVLAGAAFPPARQDGLGNQFISGLGWQQFLKASLLGTALLLPGFLWGDLHLLVTLLAGLLLAFTAAVLLSLWAKRLLGGITGDILGAVNEIAEAAFLLGAIIWWGLN